MAPKDWYISEVMVMQVKTEDEYQHLPPSDNPLWWENYQFNGYDPVGRIGVSIYTAIKPVLEFKEDYVIIHKETPLFFRDQKELEKDVLKSGALKMEPLQLLKKWRVRAKDSFQRTKDGHPSEALEDVEFDLRFESNIPPHGFSTHRGDRYEQPGVLKGKIRLGEKTMDFEGRGIRDHSWEIRNVPSWEEWYWHMGCFESGEAVSFTYMKVSGEVLYHGWIRAGKYHRIRSILVNPIFSSDVLNKCHMRIETSKERLDINSQLISYVSIPTGEQAKSKVMETLVGLDGGRGYGFLWYGR